MTELQANFTLEPQEPINANFEIGEQTPIEATLSLDVTGITEHDLLIHRDYPNQHPMTAISGLVDALEAKQDILVAGLNVQINGNVISATDTTYVAGQGISIVGNVISNTQTSAEWGNITGNIDEQTDLKNALDTLDGKIDSNHTEITAIALTMQSYGNIVTHNTSEFATAAQGLLADSALQPNDNISQLTNDVGYITNTALNGYATRSWVADQGYITGISSGDVITALGYTPYNATNPNGYITSSALNGYATETFVTSQGYITGINSTDVTTALGYTPYDSANPAGYITSAALPTVNNSTINIQKNGTTIKSFTLNQASNETINIPVPTDTADLTNGAGYITSSALSPYALSANLATVATSGSYTDLTDKPTIPTVNNSTITLTQGGTTKGTFSLNQSSNQTIDFDAGGGTPSNMVTTDTDQNITGVKTFVGDKRIKFKQGSSTQKLGFTLYDSTGKEACAFEYRPNTINTYPLLYLGQYRDGRAPVSSYISSPVYVGFRNYELSGSISAAYMLVAPLARDAQTPFSLTSTYQTFYLPLGVTDGTTTVTTASTGLLNISSLIPTVDQTYDGTSTHAQSGVAIASVLGDIESAINTIRGV